MPSKFSSIIDANPARSVVLLANLVPLVGVLFYNWDPKNIFIVYCLETVIIGFFTILKMGLVGMAQPKHLWSDSGENKVYMPTAGFILFFIVHYGLFVTIQTGMFFTFADIGDMSLFGGIQKLFAFLDNRESKILLLTFVISYAISDFGFFVLNKNYKDEPMGLVMFSPYGRIFVQQFVVILGGFLLHFFHGAIFMTVFIAVKIYVESYLNFDGRLREEFLKRFKKE